MGFVVPERGIYESDAPPGRRAWVLYVAGERRVRLEVPDDARDEALMFLWSYLCAHDRLLRLLP